MHTAIALRDGEEVLYSAEQVVSVEHRIFANTAKAIGAMGADVTVRANEHARVAEEGADTADGFGAVVVETIVVVLPLLCCFVFKFSFRFR